MHPDMKKPLIFTATAAALFGAGYWAGQARRPGEAESPPGGAVSAVLSGQKAAGPSVVASAAARQELRDFTPGRPFAKGEAKAWLLSLASSLDGDGRIMAIAMVDVSQQFLTMDEASIMEAGAALRELLAQYEAGDPAITGIHDADDLLEGGMMLTLIRLAQIRPEAALEVLQESPDVKSYEAMLFVFGRLAADNPQRAEQIALTFEGKQRGQAMEAILYSMAGKNPAGALEFAARYPEDIDDYDRQRVLETWARRNPREASEAAVQSMQHSGNPEVLRNTLEEWWKLDAKAAAAWAAGLQGPASVTAQAMFLEKRAGEEPEAVLQEYAALQQAGGDAKNLGRLTGTLAESLAEKDLPAARDWAQSLPSGELQDTALSRVAEHWVKDDAPAASEWIRTLPEGIARDNAARILCNAISRRDPASAFTWAQSISHENQRRDTMGRVMDDWRQQDPEAAKAALEALPAALREGLR